jgi:hypothetical protein
MADLAEGGEPAPLQGHVLERGQEHRLADTAKAGDQHAALGPAPFQSTQQQLEVPELFVTAG